MGLSTRIVWTVDERTGPRSEALGQVKVVGLCVTDQRDQVEREGLLPGKPSRRIRITIVIHSECLVND